MTSSAPVGLLQRAHCRLRRLLAPPTLVLLYHRVLPEPGRDVNQLAVRTKHFAAHLAWLKRHCQVLSAEAFLAQRRQPPRFDWDARPRVLLTFDDAYADNVTHALPLLVQYNVPAVVFVCSALVGTAEPFWWDALEQIVYDRHSLPPTSLTSGDDRSCHPGPLPSAERLGEGRLPSPRSTLPQPLPVRERSCEPAICTPPAAGVASADAVYATLHAELKPLSHAVRAARLAALAKLAGVTPHADADARPAAYSELVCWIAAGMTVGAHTRTHAQLSTLDDAALEDEIEGCRADLAASLNAPIDLFSYPFGTGEDVDARCQRHAAQAGFRAAFINAPGHAHAKRDPYGLPRYLVRDWPVATLAAHVARWSR